MEIIQRIQTKIYEIRGQRVMLDYDLAQLYEVETRVMNQAVKRNIMRFPEDFMFQLSKTEWDMLRSQIGINSNELNKCNNFCYHLFVFVKKQISEL